MEVRDKTVDGRQMSELSLLPNLDVAETFVKPQTGSLTVPSRGPSSSVL